MTNTNYKTFRGIAKIEDHVFPFEVVAIDWESAKADLTDAYGEIVIVTRSV